ncbi:MAG: hypothetical protein E4H19_09730 [Chromatiales bacterium]|nr:MAG: hypothetical protein E4H19_09730 [Chromatiales bacterium]
MSAKTIRSLWRDWLARVAGGARMTELPMAERRASERRSHSVWSFTYGNFRPRRRLGRRDRDHERIYLDWHEPAVLYLVLAIVLMSCADALFTLNLMAIGAEEINALMGALISLDVRHFIAVKIGVTCISVVILAFAARRQFLVVIPVFRVLQLFCAGYFALILWELWLFSVYINDLPFHWRPWSDLP